LTDMKLIQPSVDEIIKGIPEVTEQWRDTFGI
jgi:iron(III) transport system substrate-binding protein